MREKKSTIVALDILLAHVFSSETDCVGIKLCFLMDLRADPNGLLLHRATGILQRCCV